MTSDFFLVMPAYRELARLPDFLRALTAALAPADFTTEILIVDDGSPPEEQRRLRGLIPVGTGGACRVLEPLLLPHNGGKGGAIIEGWRRAADPGWVAFVDADGGTPAAEVFRVLEIAAHLPATSRPACWGSRVRMLGRRTNRRQGRYLMGRLFANLAGLILGLPVHDCQCGFKLVPAAAYRCIAPLLTESGYCFDAQLLLALRHAAVPVIEIPVDWTDMPGGHIRVFRDGARMVWRLMVLRQAARAWPILT